MNRQVNQSSKYYVTKEIYTICLENFTVILYTDSLIFKAEIFFYLFLFQAIHLRNFLTFHKNLEHDIITLQADLHLNGPFQLKYDFAEALQKILFYKNKLVDYKEKEFRMKCDSKFFHVALKPLDSLKSLENVSLIFMFIIIFFYVIITSINAGKRLSVCLCTKPLEA